MADGKGTARARRSRPAQIIGSQRTQNGVSQGNRVNVALPFSMIRAEEPVTMRVGTGSAWLDWWSRPSGSAWRSGNSSASHAHPKQAR